MAYPGWAGGAPPPRRRSGVAAAWLWAGALGRSATHAAPLRGATRRVQVAAAADRTA